MNEDDDILACIAFDSAVIEWRGPAPFYFLAVPEDRVGEVAWAARFASYGWGCVPAEAEIAGHRFTTALIPRNGGYLLPLKVAVRKAAGITGDAPVGAVLTIRSPSR